MVHNIVKLCGSCGPQDPQPPPAKKEGDLIPASPNGSPLGRIADIDVGNPRPISTKDSGIVPSIINRPTQPLLPESVVDHLPIAGAARQFLFDYTTHNFEHAFLSFGRLAVELSPLGSVRVVSKTASLSLSGAARAGKALSGVQLNRQIGNAHRDELAALLRAAGYEVRTEVYKRTPFGRRYIDIDVSKFGRILGGIEAKTGNSAYHAAQRAKDMYLRLFRDYPVNLVRKP